MKAGPPRFFRSRAAFRAWLEKHHDRADELWVGFWNKESGRSGLTWPESVEEALCFGWIDGIRRKIDSSSYCNRFTPRRKGSRWSAINIRHIERLKAAGSMHPAGLAAFEQRDPRTSGYSYEDRRPLSAAFLERLRANRQAWEFFSARPPSYRRIAAHWVMSAKKEVTRERRLGILIDCSARQQPIPPLDF